MSIIGISLACLVTSACAIEEESISHYPGETAGLPQSNGETPTGKSPGFAAGDARLKPLCLGKLLGTTLWAGRPLVARYSTPLPPPQRIVRFHSPLTRR